MMKFTTRLVIELKEKMLVSFIFLGFLLNTKYLKAQQIPHYTQYLYNMQIINPAHVGLKSDLNLSLLSRQQWAGVEGAPITNTFSISGRTLRRLGLGFSVVNEKIGFTDLNNINLDASYSVPISQKATISLGLKAGIAMFDNNFSQAITSDNDSYESFSGRHPNIGFGMVYYKSNYFIGASIPYILDTPVFKTASYLNSEFNINYQNFFVVAGAVFELSETVEYKPSLIVKNNENLPITFDINSNFVYNNLVEGGISYRYENSLSVIFAILLNKRYRIGYAYDHKLAKFGDNLYSHEIILTVDLDLNRNNRWLETRKCPF
jgi:type IX secretion system PorP/SprF family membrane protein